MVTVSQREIAAFRAKVSAFARKAADDPEAEETFTATDVFCLLQMMQWDASAGVLLEAVVKQRGQKTPRGWHLFVRADLVRESGGTSWEAQAPRGRESRTKIMVRR